MSSPATPQSLPADSQGYKMGHHPTVTASHASRTVYSDAAFLLPHLRPDMAILDIGCGPGTITSGFAAFVPHGSVTGVDTSEAVLQQAREHAAKQASSPSPEAGGGGGKVKFTIGNVLESLPFADSTFDVVYASQVFPHLSDPHQALLEIRRVLKPTGLLATRDAAAMHWYPPLPGLLAFTRNLTKSVGRDFPGPRMHGYMRAVGFAPEKMQVNCGSTTIADVEGRRWWGMSLAERFKGSEEYRGNYVKAGVSEEEIGEMVRDLQRWAREDNDGWYSLLQSEILAWK